jgi:hypothetical protein
MTGQLAMSTPMTRPSLVAIRSYRIYFRDGLNTLSPAHEVNLGSDEEARLLEVGEFSDPGLSGADPIIEQPGFAKLLDRIEGNGVRVVIVRRASPAS